MEKVFNFDKYEDFELCHIKYGRGAVITAIPKGDNKEQHYELLQRFNSRDQHDEFSKPELNPVIFVEEHNGFIKVQFVADTVPTALSSGGEIKGIIERIIPNSQVTFEVSVNIT
jgi:hypothetical protein